jgi:hypothetical protein
MDKQYETRDITGRSILRSRLKEPFVKIILITISNKSIHSILLGIYEGNILEFKALDINNSPKLYKKAYMKFL